MKKRHFCLPSLLGGVFFAAWTVLGMFFYPAGREPESLLVLTRRWSYWSAFLFFSVLFSICLYLILHRESAPAESLAPSRGEALFRRRTFLLSFLTVLLAWAPYLILCWPGSVLFDGAKQLRQALGILPLANDHSVVGTLLLGILFRIGRPISDNFGVFTVILFQTLLLAAAVGACIKKILALTDSLRFTLISLTFFAMNPVWGLYAQAVVKDTPFVALFLFYALSYVELAETVLDPTQTRPLSRRSCIELSLSGILGCLIRHEEIAVIVVSMLILALAAARERRRTAVLAAVIAALSLGSSVLAASFTGTSAPSPREVMSVFFQPTARCMKQHRKSVSQAQYEAIDAVLDADAIGELYNPLLADPVKSTYKNTAGAKELRAYLRVWWQMFRQHPRTYLDNCLQFSYSYLDPFHCSIENRTIYLTFKPVDGLDLQYSQSRAFRYEARRFLSAYLETPVLQQFVFPGTYFWVMIFCFLMLWHKRIYRPMAVLSLPVMRALICLFSPVSGYIRYALPLMVISPLMLAWVVSRKKPQEKKPS